MRNNLLRPCNGLYGQKEDVSLCLCRQRCARKCFTKFTLPSEFRLIQQRVDAKGGKSFKCYLKYFLDTLEDKRFRG